MTHSPASTSPITAEKPATASPAYPAISQREIKWGWGLLITFVLLVSLPYLWCALITAPGFTWGGLFFSADDQNVHLMWAKQAQMGPLGFHSLFIRDLFTTEGLVSGDRPLFVNLFALSVGLLSRFTGVDGIFFYHIARVAFAGLFVHQLHRLLITATDGTLERENARLGALALATLTTGGGFLLAIYLSFPNAQGGFAFLDHPVNGAFITVPEAFALLSALIYPLNIAAFALLCFLLRALIDNRPPSKKQLVWTFVGALILSNIHTYDALPLLFACLVGLGWSAIKREPIKPKIGMWSAVFVGLLLPVIYQGLVFRGSEEFRVKALTSTAPPFIWSILATFAPLLILSVFGWRSQRVSGATKWLTIYAVSVLALIYAPKHPSFLLDALFSNHGPNTPGYLFSFSRKMIEGFQIPLLVFAGAGLASLPRRRITAPLVIAILSLSPLVFWMWTIDNATTNNQRRVEKFGMPPYYLSDANAGALLTLQKVTDKNQAVLCLPLLGSYVPRATGLFTYTGHWAETLHLNRKLGDDIRFYNAQMTPDEARTFLKTNRIGYIIESPFERPPSGVSMASKLGLKSIYSAPSPSGPTVVYQVN